ncbi:MAG TPA: hypothetical protein VMB18_19290 [Terriglobales bacterium]|nr:hypothetical protein [Terriglobales bacterium]
MPRNPLPLVIALCALATTLAQANTYKDIIPAGTILQCTLDEPNFSSKTALVGDPVLCHLGPLGEFGHSVFPRGAMLGGHLEDFKNPGRLVGKGWIQVEFDRLIVPGSEPLALSAKIIQAPHMKVDAQGNVHGKGHPKRDAVGWMIPVLWPIKIATLPARGPYPAFKGESRISLRLMEDVELPYTRASVPMPPWATPSSYYGAAYDSSPRVVASSSSAQDLSIRPATYIQRSEPAAQASTPAANGPAMTIIAMKDGTAMLAQGYWVEDGKLQWMSEKGEQKALPLEQVDLYQTTQLNHERNVEFVLQSKGAVEQ